MINRATFRRCDKNTKKSHILKNNAIKCGYVIVFATFF
jgi:hypothetical protein